MHTPSLIRLLATGLMAASAVAGFHGPAASSLAVRYAGALVVAGVAILPSAVTAAPTGEDGPVEAREAKKKKKGGKKKKKTKARGLVSAPTEIEERHAAITEDHQRDARDPEAKKKKKGGKKKKTKARGLVSEPAEMDERDVDELEAPRPPEAKKKKKKGGKKKKTKARSLVASEPAGMEERDLDGLDARDPEAKKKKKKKGGKKKKTKARGLVSEPTEVEERDFDHYDDELEARDPEAKKKKKKGGKKKKTKARGLAPLADAH